MKEKSLKFPMTSIQQKIYLDCIINKDNQSKNIINMILEIKNVDDVNKFRLSIIEMFNIQPLLKSIPCFEAGKFYFEVHSNIDKSEIPIVYDNINSSITDLLKRDIFENEIILTKCSRLFRAELLKQENKFFLLMSVHHIVFDVYSGMYLMKLLGERYLDIIDVEKEQELAIHTLENCHNNLSVKRDEAAAKYYTSKLDNMKSFSNVNVQKFFYREETRIGHLTESKINTKSAVALYAIAEIMMEELSVEEIIIGVPVPNRNKYNKNLVSCLVNMMPIAIRKNKDNDQVEIINDIKKQLFKNIFYQSFDFTSKFRNKGSFICSFTYYPSTLSYKNKECELVCTSISSPMPPTPIHIMMDDTSKVVVESNLEDIDAEKLVKKILNKMEIEFKIMDELEKSFEVKS